MEALKKSHLSGRSIGEEVEVVGQEIKGRVDAILLDSCGIQYRLVYWLDGERKSTWVYDWELYK